MRLSLSITATVMIILTLLLSECYDKKPVVGKLKQLPHFTKNGDGTITNNGTKQIWLKNINCIGKRTWAEALSICKSLADGSCDLTDDSSPGSWRIPKKKELLSLLDPGNVSPVLPPQHPFIGTKNGCYWLVSTGHDGSANASYLYIGDGGAGLGGMNICSNIYNRQAAPNFYLWPVRSGSDVRTGQYRKLQPLTD